MGHFLRKKRKELGLSVEEVAKKLKNSTTHVFELERGVRKVPISRLEEVAKVFGTDPVEIWIAYQLPGWEIVEKQRKQNELSRHKLPLFDSPVMGQNLPKKGEIDVFDSFVKQHHEEGAEALLPDIEQRILHGEQKYGYRLETNNGRSAAKDLYEELLDALVYLHQFQLEGGKETLRFHRTLERYAVQVKNVLGDD